MYSAIFSIKHIKTEEEMESFFKKSIALVLAMVMMFSLLAGCSNSETETTAASSDNENTEATSETTAEGEPKMGGEISVALMKAPSNFDMDCGAGWEGSIILNHVYEGLFEFNAEDTPMPHLAESYTVSEDGKIYNIVLRQGVKFSDGEEMNAEDVKASMDRWFQANEAGINIASSLVGVEIVNDYEIKVEFSTPYAPFINMIASPVSAQKLTIKKKEIVDKFGTEVITEHIGTGPYVFDEIVMGQKVVLVRNENYTPASGEVSGTAGERVAYLDKITIEFVPEESVRVAGLQSGQYDFIDEVSTERYAELEAMPNTDPVICKFGTINVLAFNCGGDVFKNKLIRQAVAYAVDNEELGVAQIGDERFWSVTDGSWFKEGSVWYDGEAGQGVYNAKDTEKAKELLAEAGYNGETVVILATKTDIFQSNGALVLQTQLQEIGMNVEIELYDAATVSEKRTNGDWDMMINRWSDMNPDPQVFGPWTGTNGWITRWDDEDSRRMDEIFSRMIVEMDQDKRYEIVQEFYDEFWESVPYLKSFNDNRFYGKNSSLQGYQAYGQPYFWNVWLDE